MTTPTQAQIDAARMELHQVASGMCHPDDCKRWLELNYNLLYAALTAAAVTESRLKTSEDLRTGLVKEIHRQHKEIERLKIQVIERDSAIAGWIKREAATIERCAQVAENMPDDISGPANPYEFARAIRALKEKP